MAYVVGKNNAAPQTGASINGYRVKFFQDGKWQSSQRFNTLARALGFQNGLKFGRNSRIIPVRRRTR